MAAQVGSLFVSLTADVQPYATAMARAQSVTAQATSGITRSAGVAERSVNSFWGSMGNNSFRPYSLLAVSRAFDNAADRAGLLRGSLLATTAVFGGFTAALSSNLILRYADSYNNLINRIRVVSDSSADAAARFEQIQAVANRSRSTLEATAILYSRIQNAVPDRAASEVFRFVETINKALQLGGATAQEARSAAIQFSQALASNRLGGEELRTILETPLGLELARGLGVTIGKLRELSVDGKLTAGVILGALENIAEGVDQKFARSVQTVDQALTFVDNKLTEYIGSVDKAYGVTRLLSGAIVGFGNNLESIFPIIGGVAGAFAAAFIGRGVSKIGTSIAASITADAKLASDHVDALREQVKRLRKEYREGVQTKRDIRSSGQDPLAVADKDALATYEKASARLVQLDAQRLASNERIRQSYAEIAAVTATMSPKAAKLSEDLAKAEDRLNQNLAKQAVLRHDLAGARTAELGALGLQSTTGKIQAATDATRARVAIEKELATVQKAVAKDQDIVATKQMAIASLRSDADRKAADQRLALIRTIAAEQTAATKIDLDRDQAVIQSRAALAAAEQSGSKATATALKETAAGQRALGRQIRDTVADHAVAQRAATATGLTMDKLRSAGSGFLAALGGPWGAAITVAVTAIGALGVAALAEAQKFARARQQIQEELDKLAKAGDRTATVTLAERQIKEKKEELEGLADLYRVIFREIDQAINSRALGGSRLGGLELRKQISQVFSDFRAGKIDVDAFRSRLDALGDTNGVRSVTNEIGKLGPEVVAAAAKIRTLKAEIEALQATAKSPTGGSQATFQLQFTDDESIKKLEDEILKLRLSAGTSIDRTKAIEAGVEAQRKGKLANEDAIATLEREVRALRQNKEARDEAIKSAVEEAEANNKAARDRAIATDTWRSEFDARLRNQRLKSQDIELQARVNDLLRTHREFQVRDNEVRARANELFDEHIKAGREFTYEQTLGQARSQLATEKTAAAFTKARQELDSFTDRFKRLKEEAQGSFLGDIDRQVVELARQMKASAADIKAYVDAAKSGDFSKVSKPILELRDIELIKAAGAAYRDVAKEYGTLNQIAPQLAEKQKILNIAVAEGALTSQQAKLAYADYVAQFGNFKWISDAGQAFGRFATDLAIAVSEGKSLNDVFKTLQQTLLKLALDETIGKLIKDLVRLSLTGLFASPGGNPQTGGGGFDLASLLAHGGGKVGSSSLPSRRVPASAFSGAPHFAKGYTASEFPAILHKGERVLTEHMERRTMNAMNGLSRLAGEKGWGSGGGGGGTVVNVHTPPGAEVEHRSRQSGGESVEDIYITMHDKAVQSGRADASYRQRYGVAPRGVRR